MSERERAKEPAPLEQVSLEQVSCSKGTPLVLTVDLVLAVLSIDPPLFQLTQVALSLLQSKQLSSWCSDSLQISVGYQKDFSIVPILKSRCHESSLPTDLNCTACISRASSWLLSLVYYPVVLSWLDQYRSSCVEPLARKV